ncbi:MAG: 3-oxoacyl-ACP reductase FabG [Desulfobacterales bacterium]|nr:3-oxoacyl-ACP reductase FabG [Deltaproteobacteria bacterium]NNK94888.1 3-oxoacyl-ACP reductase FabG [Desulfobacterales bacterium]
MDHFTGQKVIITGATRGIGREIAKAFLDHGAHVIGLYNSNSEAADLMQKECEGSGKHIQLHCINVADHLQVQKFFSEIETQIETIDILINNAGIRKDAIAALMSFSEWNEVLDVNLTGTFNMSKFAVPLMLKQKFGRIINITSPVSYLGFHGQANYAASKAGQIGFTKTLARETARKKITVNCVSPGFIKTDLINDLTTEQLAVYKKMVPMQRFGTTAEVADAVLFLASQKASYITGAVLDVTGGL